MYGARIISLRLLLRTLALTALCLLVLMAGRAMAGQPEARPSSARQPMAVKPAAFQILWTGTDMTPLRSERSGEAMVLKELPRGLAVRLVKGEGAWLMVREPGGVTGWAYQGHLLPAPPPVAGPLSSVDLFAPLPASLVLAEVADTARSSRSVRPVRSKDTESLLAVLEMPLSRANLDEFLRQGGIGEYARVQPHGGGGVLRLPALSPAGPSGGEAERLLGLNLAVAVVRRVARPVFGAHLQRYVNLVGLSVARFAPGQALAYRFVVLDSPVPLSFSLPGGYVMLTMGLVQALENEAQLALVLAHEAAHASLGHVWARAQQAQFFQSGGTMTDAGVLSPLFKPMLDEVLAQVLRQGLEEKQELAADAAALQMGYRAGYDPLQLAAAIRAVERTSSRTETGPGTGPQWNALHPPLALRLERIQALLARLPMQDGLALGTERFRANR